MVKDKSKRLALAKRRVQTLVSQGVPFNPAKASDTLIDQAVANNPRVDTYSVSKEAGATGSIYMRVPGTARSPKGGPVAFTSSKRKYR